MVQILHSEKQQHGGRENFRLVLGMMSMTNKSLWLGIWNFIRDSL